MVWNILIPAAAALIGGSQASKAAKSAANTSAAASDRASELQREMFERNIELQAPFREAGVNALNKLTPLATEYTPFGMGQFEADPGYAFRLSEGQKALDRSASMRGGLISGGALKAAQRYGQEMGSQEYQNAFNRYQTERSARLNPLQSLAGVGQTSTAALGTAGTQFANTMGNIGMNQANVMGNAQMARASAYGDTANQLANLAGRYYGGGTQAAFSQTPMGGSGFGSGMAYGNQDLGQYL
jgi:hypothetical protein